MNNLNSSLILKTTSVVILLFLVGIDGFAQMEKYPLSRQDSASFLQYDSITALRINEKRYKEATRYLNLSAMIFWEHNHFQKAIEYYEKSLKYNQQLQNENGIAMINNNLAMIYADVQNYQQSLTYFQKTLAARRAQKEKIGIISALVNMSVVLNNMHQYQQSISAMKEALDIAREMNDPNQMKSCYGMLSETYEKAGISDTAMYYFDLYRTFHEMVQEKKVKKTRLELENERLRRELVEAENQKQELEILQKNIEINQKEEKIEKFSAKTDSLRKNLTKKELALRVIKNENRINELEIEKERQQMEADRKLNLYTIVGLILFLILIGGFAILLWFRNREKRITNTKLSEQNAKIIMQSEEIRTQTEQLKITYDQLEQKNEQITSSIQYAKLIQNAMLNKKINIADILANAFIFFKPKAIVSGDFYWYAQTPQHTIIAAVDCTGHGVPGAFMSMIGNNLLNNIILEKQITDPAQILYNMDEGVKQSLNQEHTKMQDGMDMALVVINKEKNLLQFAGARNPLVLIINNQAQIIKADRYSIGGKSISSQRKKVDKKFTTQQIQIKEKTQLYIFSDGIVDQFGGPKERKLMLPSFTKYLAENTANIQNLKEREIERFFNSWKGHHEQIDDVLLISATINPQQ